MTLGAARLAELQLECMAWDVDFDAARMASWSEDEAVAFFESGGVEAPDVR